MVFFTEVTGIVFPAFRVDRQSHFAGGKMPVPFLAMACFCVYSQFCAPVKSCEKALCGITIFERGDGNMEIIKNMNSRAGKFSILDLKLAQGAAMLFALIAAKLIPQIMDINVWLFVALLVIVGIKPFYMFLIK